jgi:hypothetical protein
VNNKWVILTSAGLLVGSAAILQVELDASVDETGQFGSKLWICLMYAGVRLFVLSNVSCPFIQYKHHLSVVSEDGCADAHEDYNLFHQYINTVGRE